MGGQATLVPGSSPQCGHGCGLAQASSPRVGAQQETHDLVQHHAGGRRCSARYPAPSCTRCTIPILWSAMLYEWCTMSCTIVHRVHADILVAPPCRTCTKLLGWYTMSCTIVDRVQNAIWVVHDVLHHRAPAVRCYMGGARCRSSSCTRCWMVYVVHHRAPGVGCYMCGAQCYMGGTRCRAPLCNGCKMLYWWCVMSCTVVHRVQGTTFVVHDVVHHRVPGAGRYMGDALFREPSCTGCTMLCGWCTVLCTVIQRVQATISGARGFTGCTMSCTIVHWVNDVVWVLHSVVHDDSRAA